MKRNIVLFLFTVISLTAFSQPNIDRDPDTTLTGPIKSILEKQYSSDDLNNYRWAYEYRYDKDGKFTEEYHYDQQLKDFYLKEKHTYDKNGRKQTISNYDRDGEMFSKDSFVYNASGTLIKKYDYTFRSWSDPTVTLDEYELNKEGQVIAYYNTYSNQERRLMESYSYDKSGNQTEIWRFTRRDTTLYQTQYDSKGRAIKKTKTRIENGQRLEPCVDSYTFGNNEIKSERGCRGDLTEIQKLDDKGRIIYESWAHLRKSGEKDYYIINSTYNDHDLIIKEVWEDNRNREKEVKHFTKLFEFEFDEYGNWIKLTRKRIEDGNEEIFMVFEREITYYE